MDWDYGHTALLEYRLRAWIGLLVTQPGFRVRPQGMDWDYGHTAWFSSTASGHGLGLWSHSQVSEYGLRARIGITVTQFGLAVRPQGMDWDYGHTAWFSSTALGHGLGVYTTTGDCVGSAPGSCVVNAASGYGVGSTYGLRAWFRECRKKAWFGENIQPQFLDFHNNKI
jgi:hypothetical protein